MIRASRATVTLVVGICGLALVGGYLNKARCAGPPFDADGRSAAFDQFKDRNVCYSDIQFLWLGRDINHHVFPFLDGGITSGGVLTGGAVEYPVLSGVLMWLGAIGAHNDSQFLLYSALLLAPFGLATAWMLGRLAGRSALWWSACPPLVLYAFHNWELPVVATAVGAAYLVAAGGRWSLRARGVVAAVLLGIGFCLKLYPGAFVIPLAALVLTGGFGGTELPRELREQGRRFDVRGALMVISAAVATVVVINLPFAVAGYEGWRASFTFQSLRKVDITTNSIWYWGARPIFGDGPAFQDALSTISPVLILLSFALAWWLGWRRFLREGTFPWVAVSGAMLCGFLLLHKVHSPQYTLWLIPFFVLLRVPWPLIGGYLLADFAMGVGVFRYFHSLNLGHDVFLGSEGVVQFGVWGRALLLVVFFILFSRAQPRGERQTPPAATLEDPLAARTVVAGNGRSSN